MLFSTWDCHKSKAIEHSRASAECTQGRNFGTVLLLAFASEELDGTRFASCIQIYSSYIRDIHMVLFCYLISDQCPEVPRLHKAPQASTVHPGSSPAASSAKVGIDLGLCLNTGWHLRNCSRFFAHCIKISSNAQP